MLKKILNNTQQKLVELLVGEGEKSLSDITKIVGMSKPTISKHLKELTDLGIIKERKERTETGKIAVYSLDRFTFLLTINPNARSIVSIETKSEFDLPYLLLEQVRDEEFKEDLRIFFQAFFGKKENERLIALILFGSVAEEKGTWKSDIDLAFLDLEWNDASKGRVEGLVSDVGMETRHQIKPYFLTKLQFQGDKSLLASEIKKSGMVIYSDLFKREEIWKEMQRYKSITQ
ncbi:MAG: ArsR family transcriptional regulator [Thermoplasmata archaeon]